MRTTLVVSDIQHPYEDKQMVSKVLAVASDMQPDQIVFVGDVIDFTEVGRWTKAKAGEYEPTLQRNLDGTRDILSAFRDAAPAAVIRYSRANHEDRLEKYIADYAPALRTLRDVRIESLLRLDSLGISYERRIFEACPGVLICHGDEVAYSVVPGKLGLGLVARFGRSVVHGHSHRPNLSTVAVGHGGRLKSLFAMDVGSLMDFKQVSYIPSGHMNWTHGFGILREDGRTVVPELVLAQNRKFYVDGRWY